MFPVQLFLFSPLLNYWRFFSLDICFWFLCAFWVRKLIIYRSLICFFFFCFFTHSSNTFLVFTLYCCNNLWATNTLQYATDHWILFLLEKLICWRWQICNEKWVKLISFWKHLVTSFEITNPYEHNHTIEYWNKSARVRSFTLRLTTHIEP